MDARFAALRADLVNIVSAACGGKGPEQKAEDLMPDYGKRFRATKKTAEQDVQAFLAAMKSGKAASIRF